MLLYYKYCLYRNQLEIDLNPDSTKYSKSHIWGPKWIAWRWLLENMSIHLQNPRNPFQGHGGNAGTVGQRRGANSTQKGPRRDLNQGLLRGESKNRAALENMSIVVTVCDVIITFKVSPSLHMHLLNKLQSLTQELNKNMILLWSNIIYYIFLTVTIIFIAKIWKQV